MKLALEGFFSFSFVPLRISMYLGLTISAVGLIYAVVVVVKTVSGEYQGLAGWPTVIVSVLVVGGVQLVMLGIMGEYIGRIFEEIKRRPPYVIDELVGFDEPSSQ